MWSPDSKLAVCGRIRNVEGSLFHGLICFIPAEFQTTEVLERKAGKEGGREGGREERKERLQGKLLTLLLSCWKLTTP